jgi:hypothetical protein
MSGVPILRCGDAVVLVELEDLEWVLGLYGGVGQPLPGVVELFRTQDRPGAL